MTHKHSLSWIPLSREVPMMPTTGAAFGVRRPVAAFSGGATCRPASPAFSGAASTHAPRFAIRPDACEPECFPPLTATSRLRKAMPGHRTPKLAQPRSGGQRTAHGVSRGTSLRRPCKLRSSERRPRLPPLRGWIQFVPDPRLTPWATLSALLRSYAGHVHDRSEFDLR